MDEAQAVGFLGVADEPVGAVGFEHLVMRWAHAAEPAGVVGVAVVTDRVGVVDLEVAGDLTARDPTDAVAAPDVALHVGGQRGAGSAGGVGPRVVHDRIADLGVGPHGVDGLARNRDALDLGAGVAAGVGDLDDLDPEPARGLGIRVGAGELDEGVGLAVRERVPREPLGGAHALGHVVEDLVDEDAVDVGQRPAACAHAGLGCTPGEHRPRRAAGLGIRGGDLARRPGHALQLDRRHVRCPLRPLRIGGRGGDPGEGRELVPRERAVVRSGAHRGQGFERTGDLELGTRARGGGLGIGDRAEGVAVVEHSGGREALQAELLLLGGEVDDVAAQVRRRPAPQGIDPVAEVEALGGAAGLRSGPLEFGGERTFDHAHGDDDTQGV